LDWFIDEETLVKMVTLVVVLVTFCMDHVVTRVREVRAEQDVHVELELHVAQLVMKLEHNWQVLVPSNA